MSLLHVLFVLQAGFATTQDPPSACQRSLIETLGRMTEVGLESEALPARLTLAHFGSAAEKTAAADDLLHIVTAHDPKQRPYAKWRNVRRAFRFVLDQNLPAHEAKLLKLLETDVPKAQGADVFETLVELIDLYAASGDSTALARVGELTRGVLEARRARLALEQVEFLETHEKKLAPVDRAELRRAIAAKSGWFTTHDLYAFLNSRGESVERRFYPDLEVDQIREINRSFWPGSIFRALRKLPKGFDDLLEREVAFQMSAALRYKELVVQQMAEVIGRARGSESLIEYTRAWLEIRPRPHGIDRDPGLEAQTELIRLVEALADTYPDRAVLASRSLEPGLGVTDLFARLGDRVPIASIRSAWLESIDASARYITSGRGNLEPVMASDAFFDVRTPAGPVPDRFELSHYYMRERLRLAQALLGSDDSGFIQQGLAIVDSLAEDDILVPSEYTAWRTEEPLKSIFFEPSTTGERHEWFSPRDFKINALITIAGRRPAVREKYLKRALRLTETRDESSVADTQVLILRRATDVRLMEALVDVNPAAANRLYFHVEEWFKADKSEARLDPHFAGKTYATIRDRLRWSVPARHLAVGLRDEGLSEGSVIRFFQSKLNSNDRVQPAALLDAGLLLAEAGAPGASILLLSSAVIRARANVTELIQVTERLGRDPRPAGDAAVMAALNAVSDLDLKENDPENLLQSLGPTLIRLAEVPALRPLATRVLDQLLAALTGTRSGYVLDGRATQVRKLLGAHERL